MSKTVAIFGGSFNPPHVGHVTAVVYVLSVGYADEVLVVPCFIHPFAKDLAPFADRLAMCRAAFGWIPRVTVSQVEQQLGGESRTLRTLQTLAASHPEWSLRLVVGSDVIPETPRWFGFPEIARLAPLIVLDRPDASGREPAPCLFPNVSSSAIRRDLAASRSEGVARLVPARVLEHIRAAGLYGVEAGG